MVYQTSVCQVNIPPTSVNMWYVPGVQLSEVNAVDSGAPQSVALQAYRILERAVGERTLTRGTRLPSERDLAARLRVSRSTLRQVLGALADAELIEASPQRGWFVSDGPISDPPNALVSFTESARLRGIVAGSRVIDRRVRPITLGEQDELRAAPGTDILEIRRVRTLDGTPVSVDDSHVVVSRSPGIETMDLENRSLYEAMGATTGGRPIRSDYALHADGADETVAALLHLHEGSPVLVGRELAYGRSGDRLLTARLVYRADAYTFRATLYSH